MKDTRTALRPAPAWKSETTLVPFSGIQMLDFGFDLNAVEMRPRRFIERTTGQDENGVTRDLIPLFDEEHRNEAALAAEHPDDVDYGIRPVAALEPFLDKWTPAPVFRVRHGLSAARAEQYDDGPFAWARLRVTELEAPDPATGHTHRLQLAIDTTLVASNPPGRYLAPEHEDSEHEREFRFLSDPDQVIPFLTCKREDSDGRLIDHQDWVTEWLETMFKEYRQARVGGRPLRDEDFPYRFEHIARYLALLALIDRAASVPKLRLVDVVSDEARHAPVDVDLVLDIGNSRTCGILIESAAGETSVDLTDSYALEVRDLSRPELSYDGLIDSRVEFAEAQFGREHIARRARRGGFQWPSLVRVGPEAMRMIQREDGTEPDSGLSSPKRYLWDNETAASEWRFQDHRDPQNPPRISLSASRFLNDSGDVIEQVRRDIANQLRERKGANLDMATRPRFSRSALYGFMIGELICHALVQINDPAARMRRKRSDVPRRLRNVILTLPSATPMQEQAIIRSRAEGAIRLIWSILALDESAAATCARPALVVEWDEASCTQLVWLYTEIAWKFDGRIRDYFRLRGRPRAQAEGEEPRPSLRVGCIDIGGGTTDLMVTTYFEEADTLIHPRQTFREGFRVAGDDLLRDIVSTIVLERIAASIEAAGGRGVRARLRRLFGGEVAGMDEQHRQVRRQFGIRVLTPLAIAVLEGGESLGEQDEFEVSARVALGGAEAESEGEAERDPPVPEALLAYLESEARACGAEGWRLADLRFRLPRREVDACVRNVLQKVLWDMGEAIDRLGCDVVLLTGRPSRLPAVRAIIREMMLVSPDRLISMNRYRVDRWYPFRDPVSDEVGDPKSTVAVGAMLCALSRSRIANFRLMTDELKMRSTARYLGIMSRSGEISEEEVIFDGLDTEPGAAPEEVERTVAVVPPVHIGFRQLPQRRWTTTPLYLLEADEAALARPLPLKVTLKRRDSHADPENPDHSLRLEAAKEAFLVDYAEDAEGRPCGQHLRLRLHTLGFEDAYWLDTGVFRVA